MQHQFQLTRPCPVAQGTMIRMPLVHHHRACIGSGSLACPSRPMARQPITQCRSYNDNNWNDGPPGDVEAGFDEAEQSATWDTRAVMLRVLTARAVQRTMMQLQQHHVIAANWLNHYCIENPPLGGDEFLLKLYSQPALRVYDEIRRGWVIINPQDISSTVLEHRHRLSQFLVQGFPEFVGERNLQVMRDHLEAHTYTAGSHWSEQTSPSNPPRGNNSNSNNSGNMRKGGPSRQPDGYRS